ncbi:unnamed protein product [Lepidochelys kempii]
MEIVLGNCASARRITKPGGIAAAFLLCIASSRGRGSAACGPAGCPVPVPPSGAERLRPGGWMRGAPSEQPPAKGERNLTRAFHAHSQRRSPTAGGRCWRKGGCLSRSPAAVKAEAGAAARRRRRRRTA